jgi:hypothetical protein
VGDTFRVCRGEKRAHGGALGEPNDDCTARADVVHDRANVVDPLFQRWRAGDAIGQSLTSLVERHDAGERRKTAQKSGIGGPLMRELDMRDDPGNKNEINRPVAHRLIGDVDVAAQRVTGVGQFKIAHLSDLLGELCSGRH